MYGLIVLYGLHTACNSQVMQGTFTLLNFLNLISSYLTIISPFIWSIKMMSSSLSRLYASFMAYFFTVAKVLSFFKIKFIKSSFSALIYSCSYSYFSWNSIQVLMFFLSLFFFALIKLYVANRFSSSSTCLAGIDVRFRMSALVICAYLIRL